MNILAHRRSQWFFCFLLNSAFVFAGATAKPSKYLVFTTQRSGSTWFCDLLSQQEGIICGMRRPTVSETVGNTRISEMMIKYSHQEKNNYADVTWDSWKLDLEKQFDVLVAEAGEGVVAVGFKLMYNQVPPFLEDLFMSWLEKSDVTLVHLEREATPLVLASRRETKSPNTSTHAINSQHLPDSSPALQPVNLTNFVSLVQNLYEKSRSWRQRLRYNPHLRYYHAVYERLSTGHAAERYFRGVIAAILDPKDFDNLNGLKMSGNFLRLRDHSCRKRLHPALYEILRFYFPPWSTVIQACRYLDEVSS